MGLEPSFLKPGFQPSHSSAKHHKEDHSAQNHEARGSRSKTTSLRPCARIVSKEKFCNSARLEDHRFADVFQCSDLGLGQAEVVNRYNGARTRKIRFEIQETRSWQAKRAVLETVDSWHACSGRLEAKYGGIWDKQRRVEWNRTEH